MPEPDLQFTEAFDQAMRNDPIILSHVASWRISKGAYSRDEMLQRLVVTLSEHANAMFNLRLRELQELTTPNAANPQE